MESPTTFAKTLASLSPENLKTNPTPEPYFLTNAMQMEYLKKKTLKPVWFGYRILQKSVRMTSLINPSMQLSVNILKLLSLSIGIIVEQPNISF